MGTELVVACEALNLSSPKPGQVAAIWLLDKMAFGSNDPQVINEDEETATHLLQRIRLGKNLQTFSWKQGIEIPLDEEFDVWVGKLYSDAAMAAATHEREYRTRICNDLSNARFAASREREIAGVVAGFGSTFV